MSVPHNNFINSFDLHNSSFTDTPDLTDWERSKTAEHENRLQYSEISQKSEKIEEN